jgi:hypothetical protein
MAQRKAYIRCRCDKENIRLTEYPDCPHCETQCWISFARCWNCDKNWHRVIGKCLNIYMKEDIIKWMDIDKSNAIEQKRVIYKNTPRVAIEYDTFEGQDILLIDKNAVLRGIRKPCKPDTEIVISLLQQQQLTISKLQLTIDNLQLTTDNLQKRFDDLMDRVEFVVGSNAYEDAKQDFESNNK